MVDYYDKRSVKVQIAHKLKDRGWNLFGYTEDRSDSMYDIYLPASWEGVAEKNGFILLIDVPDWKKKYIDERRFVTKETHGIPHDKEQKLLAIINCKGSFGGEKVAAELGLKRLRERKEKGREVVRQYPDFEHANPRACSWHIEKDRAIIAKGKGVYSLYDCNDREGTEKRIEKFLDKVESKMFSGEQVEAVKVTKKKKVKKPVELDVDEIKVGHVVRFERHLYSGIDTGSYWVVKEKNEKRYRLHRLGKRYQELKQNFNNYGLFPTESIDNFFFGGQIKVFEVKEVEEEYEAVKYKKVRRSKSDYSALIEGETESNVEYRGRLATKRQLYALFCATKIKTTGAKIPFERAKELIGLSKSGVDISEMLKEELKKVGQTV